VVGIGGIAFDAVRDNFAHRMDVFIDGVILHAVQFAELDLVGDRSGGPSLGAAGTGPA